MTLTRKKVIAAAAILLIIPAVGWMIMVKLDLIGLPGEPLRPPFNSSDRISTIEIVEKEDGSLVARFDGWKEGDKEMTADEFYKELQRRGSGPTWLHRWLNVTSTVGILWILFGFAAQAVFSARLIVQLRASEKAKSSVVPVEFWWLSLLGASMLMVYFIWRKDPVGFLGQATGWIVYIRNLWFIYGKNRPAA